MKSSLTCIVVMVAVLKLWKPKNIMRLEGDTPASITMSRHSAGELVVAWSPYLLLVVFVLLWGEASIKPRINDKKMVGPAVTILEGPTDEFLPPQHALDAIDMSPEGSVICIAISGEKNVAVWGGLMTAGAVANKHEGAVLDGGVRDITEIRRDYDFPVFSRSVSPGTTLGRFRTYSANEPVMIGGVIVHPGDIIVAINGQAIDSVARLQSRLDDYAVGATVRLTVMRDKQRVEVPVRLQASTQ